MYAIKENVRSYIVSDAVGTPLYYIAADGASLVRDGDGQRFLLDYLEDAQAVFKREVSELLDTDRRFTEKDEERLTMMLKLLVDARKTWEEEDSVGKGRRR